MQVEIMQTHTDPKKGGGMKTGGLFRDWPSAAWKLD